MRVPKELRESHLKTYILMFVFGLVLPAGTMMFSATVTLVWLLGPLVALFLFGDVFVTFLLGFGFDRKSEKKRRKPIKRPRSKSNHHRKSCPDSAFVPDVLLG